MGQDTYSPNTVLYILPSMCFLDIQIIFLMWAKDRKFCPTTSYLGNGYIYNVNKGQDLFYYVIGHWDSLPMDSSWPDPLSTESYLN
jgi:hypothetical protein